MQQIFYSLKNNFTNWDDDRYVENNTQIHTLSSDSLKSMFSTSFEGNYHPITMISYAIEYKAYGTTSKGYIRDNLILNSIISCLAGWLLYMLFGNFLLAFFCALLFGVHTLHTESVVWVSERKDLLYSLFFLASLVSYLYYLKSNRKTSLILLTYLFFLLSLFSKGQAVTLSVVLLVFYWLYNKKIDNYCKNCSGQS